MSAWAHDVRQSFTVLVAVLTAVLAGSWAQAEPVALILDAPSGAEIRKFSEVTDGTTVELPPRSRVTFAHYARCEEVTVENGRLTIWKERYRLQGGEIVKSVPQRCPEPVSSQDAAEIGGAVLRGAGVPVADRPTLVLTGPGRGDVVAARLSKAGREVGRYMVDSATVSLPGDLGPLETGRAYTLTLMGTTGDPLGSVDLFPGPVGRDLVSIRVD